MENWQQLFLLKAQENYPEDIAERDWNLSALDGPR